MNFNTIKIISAIVLGLFAILGRSNNAYSKIISNQQIKADTLPSNLQNGELFTSADEVPEFTGGSGEMWAYLKNNIKYPESAAKEKVEGRVFVKFVVAKDGSISNPEILEGADDRLNKEAIRVVKTMPNWVPGKIEGQPVNVQIVLPILFRL